MKTEKFETTIVYYDNGLKNSEEWTLNGENHRVDGPALQFWRATGQKCLELWYSNGKASRKEGPSYQKWHLQEWWLDGQHHRTDGPAIIKFKPNGEVFFEEFWFNNQKLTKEEFKIQTDLDYKTYLELKNKFEGVSK